MVKQSERIIEEGLTIRVPIEEALISIREQIESHMKKNPDFAFTRVGLMIELFGYSAKDLNKPFSDWPKGASTQYNKIKNVLNHLIEEKIINYRKKGKMFLYWWIK